MHKYTYKDGAQNTVPTQMHSRQDTRKTVWACTSVFIVIRVGIIAHSRFLSRNTGRIAISRKPKQQHVSQFPMMGIVMYIEQS